MNARPRCRSCGAPIRFEMLEATGRWMPLNPEPSDRGNVELVGNEAVRARVLGEQDRDLKAAAGSSLYLSHFATCSSRETTAPPAPALGAVDAMSLW
ncbi:MAG: hypothetical protein WKF96_00020 [Solirubrobacteraceae bacterium]